MMRLSDLSGEKEFSGAISLICCRMVARDAGWKIWESSRRVMSKVFEGGAGDVSDGMEWRSSAKGEWVRRSDSDEGEGEDAVEVGGDPDAVSSCRREV
jgi:hypothetical protein